MSYLTALIIILTITICCLFPPSKRVSKLPNSNIKQFTPIGYGPLWDPYGPVDFDRLSIQLGLLFFLGFCLVFSKSIFPKERK